MYKYIKRMLDIAISVITLPIVIIVITIFGPIIKREDGGPVFYLSPRIGKDNCKFNMLKLRTMKVDAPDLRNNDGSTFNAADDDRVTRIGKLLRSTSIDELPQFFNVLIGSMSFVGPRASTWDALSSFKDDELDKMKVKPGITGYTQAYYRNSISVREKRLYDAWYANNYSFLLDLKIVLRTISTVITKSNLYSN